MERHKFNSVIYEIRKKVINSQFEFSKHAVDQSIIRKISIDDLTTAIMNGEVIEIYPDDKYGPSCLILGFTVQNRPIHIHCSYPSRLLLKIITIYKPDEDLWIDYRVRRIKNGI